MSYNADLMFNATAYWKPWLLEMLVPDDKPWLEYNLHSIM